ncbi:MAG TPA: PEP/pyruvate-binding domain-containing protein, partial [Candidatus Limnocylindria bacterium]|nr:PEP/pyruvate-binding domain-containing protein [Candidatus Limnocylindria bacterium]
IAEAAQELGAATFAVRSSSPNEDLAVSTSAGRYLTVLGVRPDELDRTVERVYGSHDPGSAMAVLVQPMLAASAAGVAFTADPLTGDADVVTVTAVRGLGDRLVGGEATAEEWRVARGRLARVRDANVPALSAVDAEAVVALARAIAARRGSAQDLEWAIVGGAVHVLQARPMTGLPEPVRWDAPPGAFARSFRLGEWIGDPVTPLFESWLLSVMERTMHGDYERLVGQPAPRPLHVVVNGWYYYSLNFLPASPMAIARMLPGIIARLPRHARRIAPIFPPLARFGIDVYVREWRDELLPAYREAVAAAASAVDATPIPRLPRLIDELAERAGHYFTSVTFVAGYGWKTEIPLAQFYRAHLQARVGGDYRQLIRGLSAQRLRPHAVHSLDWWFPALGETAEASDVDGGVNAGVVAERELAERRCRETLDPPLRARFERLLAEAQRGAVLREEQVAELTLPWPTLRAALRRIGTELVARGAIGAIDDVYFLRRDELDAALSDPNLRFTDLAADRRSIWERQRRLIAPLVIGTMPRMLATILGAADRAMRDPVDAPEHAIRGIPASAGRVTGPARVIWDADDFARVRQGDVLVCRVMSPASSALFGIAAAIVTDVGSPAAHASVIAREFGIPAVVGTQDATARIIDGTLVTVDGGAGLVWVEGAPRP